MLLPHLLREIAGATDRHPGPRTSVPVAPLRASRPREQPVRGLCLRKPPCPCPIPASQTPTANDTDHDPKGTSNREVDIGDISETTASPNLYPAHVSRRATGVLCQPCREGPSPARADRGRTGRSEHRRQPRLRGYRPRDSGEADGAAGERVARPCRRGDARGDRADGRASDRGAVDAVLGPQGSLRTWHNSPDKFRTS